MAYAGMDNFDSFDDPHEEQALKGERALYPCRKGTPKRSRFKKGSKRIPMNGKHRRRVRKISW